ncbi:N-methyl-L-tryptophan oxidase [Halocatena halophila]|uniref:N-methyl-L-tryptophan oxidase n=1 Tax=Halocatena halophila TaxID=2814576 RepID=UPI002ED5781B
MDEADIIVVGAGIVGCATAAHLAKEGQDVLILEAGDFPNPTATSYGSGRIFRFAYHEGEKYLPLLERSRERWLTLDNSTSENLFVTTGSLTIGQSDGDTFTGALETCRVHDINHEVLDAETVNDRFPAYELPDEYRAVYQPEGGVLDAHQCLVTLADAALNSGARLRAREPVTNWTETSDGVAVQTPMTTWRAEKIVIASGAWAAHSLETVGSVLERERSVACRFLPTDRAAFAPESFPVFVMDVVDGRHFYGMPEPRLGGFKVGAPHVDGVDVHPEDNPSASLDEADAARGFAQDFAPAGDGSTMGIRECVLTHTPDGDFIIDHLPGRDRVVVAVGMSGHGFKLAPAVGELAAALVAEDTSPIDASAFSVERF